MHFKQRQLWRSDSGKISCWFRRCRCGITPHKIAGKDIHIKKFTLIYSGDTGLKAFYQIFFLDNEYM